MKRIVLILLLLAVVAAGAIVYHNLSRPAPKAVDLLPDSTLLFLDIPDINASRADFRSTELYAFLHEPEVDAFIEKPLSLLRQAIGHNLDDSTRDLVLDAMQGEVFLAVTQISVLPSIQAGVVFGADVKNNRVQTEAALLALERRLLKQRPNARFEKKSALGVKYSVWEIRPGYSLCQASLHSLIVFTLGEDTMADVIVRFQHKSAPASSLGASAKFRSVRDHTPAAHEFLAYVNVEEVTALIGPFMALAPQGGSLMRKLAPVQATGTSFTFSNNGGVEDVAVLNEKLPNPKPRSPVPRATLSFTTPQTLLYAAQSSDLAGDYDQTMESLSQAGTAVADGAAKFERAVRGHGIRLREDVLAHLGPETATIAQWRDGARFPDVAIVTAFSDAAQTRTNLDVTMDALKEATLGDDSAAPWEESQHTGHALRTVRIGPGLVAPTYATTEKFFILALTPDYARELLSQIAENKPTLATNAEYQKASARLPAQTITHTYCDLRGVFTPLYKLAQTAASNTEGSEWFDFDKLPKTETIAKHLFPYTSATTVDGATTTSAAFSPFGRPIVLLGGIALGAGAVGPHLPGFPFSSAAPTTSSSTHARPAPLENPAAPSGTPAPQ